MSNVDTLKAHYAASARKDLEGMLAPLDSQVAWTEMEGFPYRGTFYGPQGVAQNVFARIGAEWDGYDATPDQYIDGGDTVAVTGLYTGTNKSTGRYFRGRFVHVWHFNAQGKVDRFEQFTDTLLAYRAMQQG